MQITIRKATVDDAGVISSIGVASWQVAYRGIVPDSYLDALSVEKREKYLQESLSNPSNHFAIAEVGGEAVGMICFYNTIHENSEEVWEIEAIYLLPEYWNKGIGHTLMQYAFKYMCGQKANNCKLWVLADNTLARRFYEHIGMVDSGMQKDITIGGKELIEVCYQICLR